MSVWCSMCRRTAPECPSSLTLLVRALFGVWVVVTEVAVGSSINVCVLSKPTNKTNPRLSTLTRHTPDLAFLRATRVAMAGGATPHWNFTGLDVAAVAAWLRSAPSPGLSATQEQLERERDHAAAREATSKELRLMKAASITLLTSPLEAQLIGALLPGLDFAVVGNIHSAAAPAASQHGHHSSLFRQTSSRSSSSGSGSGSGSGSSSSRSGWQRVGTADLTNQQHNQHQHGATSTSNTDPPTCQHRRGILFVGNFNHLPNQQAVTALVQDVLPEASSILTPDERAEFTLHIVGGNSLVEADLTASELQIFNHGWLPDAELELLYGSVRLVVAPLLSGAGVKGKVNQAMVRGVPVILTPIAAEGMRLTDGVDAVIASTPAEFARKMVALYRDCAAWERIAAAGRESAAKHFSVARATRRLAQVLVRLGFAVPVPRQMFACVV